MPLRLQSVRSFALYYGMGGEAALSTVDLAIVDPGGRDAGGVVRLKQHGTLALAYLSLLEIPQGPGSAVPEGVLFVAGQPQTQPEFANWILDPRLPQTRSRMHQIAEQCMALGYDGFFLDTVADLEDIPFAAGFADELTHATARLIAELAGTYACCLVQNRGFARLLPFTVAYLDGVCWESFPYRHVGLFPARRPGIRSMQQLQKGAGVKVLALNSGLGSPRDFRDAVQAARRAGFLWYGTNCYTDLSPTLQQR